MNPLLSSVTILMAIAGLGLLIFVHEFGHFIAAKLFGIKVKEAFLGFGPKLVQKQWGETNYGISALPLGGYVKLAGMEPEEPTEEDEEEERTFDSKSIAKRIGVIVAGPLMNLLVAIPIFALIFYIGVPVTMSNTVEKVLTGSIAQKAGLKDGDKIVEIDGKKVNNWKEVIGKISPRAGDTVNLVIQRGSEKISLRTKVGKKTEQVPVDGKLKKKVRGFLGIQGSVVIKRYSVLASLKMGYKMTIDYTKAMLGLFKSLFTGEIPVSTVTKGSAGPVGVIYLSSKMAQKGFIDFLWLLGVISPNLAIMNLLPFPPLDGGRISFLIYEGIRGKPVSRERMMQFQTVGVTILIFLMVVLIISDATKILTNQFPLEGF